MARSLFETTMPSSTLPEGSTFYRTALGALVVSFNNTDQGCPPKMRVRFGGESLDAPVDEVAEMLDEALGPQRWVESSRVTTSDEVNGVTIERIDEVTFNKPTGGQVTLVFNHPPIQSSGGGEEESFFGD